MIDELPPGLDLRGEHREALPDALLLVERPAEGLPRRHVIDREIERGLRLAHRHRADHGALVLEVAHDRVEAAAFLAEQVLGRDAAILEHELRGVG